MQLFKKIDLYFAGDYICSTKQAKTCREAKQKYLEKLSYYKNYLGLVESQVLKNPKLLKAYFDKDEIKR